MNNPNTTESDTLSDTLQHKIQWYPGHIAKHERALKEKLKLVDVVVEVLDARLPKTTVNPRLQAQIRSKPTVLVINKTDLADATISKQWLGYFKHTAKDAFSILLHNTKSSPSKSKNTQGLLTAILKAGEAKMQQLVAKGLKRRAIRVLVIGMPNVGKSSIINHLVGKNHTKTGHKAGVTRGNQWVRIHKDLELLDSPGIIPPSLDTLDSDEAGALLAVVNSIGEASFDDEEIGRFLAERLETLYPGVLRQYFKIPPDYKVDLNGIAIGRRFMALGDRPDTLRAAQSLLSEFRQGRLGRFCLEWPPQAI